MFISKHVILTVIHAQTWDQVLTNAEIAKNSDCDGIFLINHGMDCGELLKLHYQLHNRLPDWWTGLNCLDLDPSEVFWVITNDVAGVWVDNAGIDERSEDQAPVKQHQEKD